MEFDFPLPCPLINLGVLQGCLHMRKGKERKLILGRRAYSRVLDLLKDKF